MAVSLPRAGRAPARDVVADAKQVQKLFQKAWPRAERYPDIGACYRVAGFINVVRVARPTSAPEIPVAFKYCRLLLRHLPALRQTVEADLHNLQRWNDIGYRAGGLLEDSAALLDAIEQTERCVRALVEGWKPARPRPPNPATFIASKVQEAWAGIPGAKAIRSNSPSSPLCIFVRDALAMAGKHFALESVSDMLRERHRRERQRGSGKIKKQRDKSRG